MSYTNNLISINSVGEYTPLIFVHGEDSNFILGKNLPRDQPFFSFLHLGSDGERIIFNSIEEFSDYYLSQLKKIIPHGPYILAGYSFGGLIAYEMALELKKRNEEVQGLILLDTGNPQFYFKRGNLKKLLEKSSLNKRINKRINQFVKRKYIFALLLLGKRIPVSLRNMYILDKYKKLSKRYHPQVIDINVLLFRATENLCIERNLGWEGLIDNLEIVDLKGSHRSMLKFEQNIQRYLDNLKRFIKVSA